MAGPIAVNTRLLSRGISHRAVGAYDGCTCNLHTELGVGVDLLENPIWNALRTEHRSLAMGDGPARRYPAEIGPLSGVEEESAEAFAALREITPKAGAAVLFLRAPVERLEGWSVSLFGSGGLDQMVWDGGALPAKGPLRGDVVQRELGGKDVPAMVELARLTQPGPFDVRTHELGDFFGIFEGDRLLAMAGQRLAVPGMAEVSALCTHPDARGRGYGRRLMLEVMAGMVGRGETPFLHTLPENPAIRLYEELGFRRRRGFCLRVLQRD